MYVRRATMVAVIMSAAVTVMTQLASARARAHGAASVAGSVTVNMASDWQTMDHQATAPGDMWWETGGYDRLTELYDGKVVPYLATSWTVARDNKLATFRLRHGVRCQNGTLLTPRDVAASFHRLFTVPKKSVSLNEVLGPGPWSITYNDKKWTVTIKLGTAFNGLVSGLADPSTSVICPNGLAHPTRLQTGIYGSGPYKLVSAVHADKVVLERNDKWTWGPVVHGHEVTWRDLPKRQVWDIISNPATLASNLLTGAVQVGSFETGTELYRLRGKANVTPVPLNFPISMVMQQGPGHSTNSGALRTALSLLVNPHSLNVAQNGGSRVGKLVTSFIQPFQECYSPSTKKLYPSGGVAKAERVLAAAGYTGIGTHLTAPDGTPVTIRVVTTPVLDGNSGPYLQQAFAPLGANVQLSNPGDISTFVNEVYGGQEDVGVAEGGGTNPAPASTAIDYFFGAPLAQGGANALGPDPSENPAWNSLMNKTVGSHGCGDWIKAQKMVLQEHLFLPVAEADWYIASSKGVTVASSSDIYEPWTIR